MANNAAISKAVTDAAGQAGAAAPHFSTRALRAADSTQSVQPLQLLSQVQRLFQNRWISLPAAGPLHRLAQETLDAAEQYAARGNAPPLESASPFELDAIRRRHDCLQSQFGLLDLLGRQTVILGDLAAQLLNERSLPYTALTPLASHILEFARAAKSPDDILPLPGLDAGELIGALPGAEHSALHSGPLLAALQIAWLLKDKELSEPRLLSGVFAAGLQDVGIVALRPHLIAARNEPDRIRRLAEQHPAAGAALLGAVAGAPPSLARAVARHHERIDGRGFPRRLQAEHLPGSVRLLGVVNRFQALYRAAGADVECGAPLANALARLADETRQGLWDSGCVDSLTERMADGAAPIGANAAPLETPLEARPVASAASETDNRSDAEELARRNLELHARQPQLRGGHHERSVAAGARFANG